MDASSISSPQFDPKAGEKLIELLQKIAPSLEDETELEDFQGSLVTSEKLRSMAKKTRTLFGIPQAIQSTLHNSTYYQALPLQVLKLASFISNLMDFLSDPKKTISPSGEFLFNERCKVPLLKSGIPPEDEKKKLEEGKQNYEEFHQFFKAELTKNHEMIGKFNSISLNLYLLSIFNQWSHYASTYGIKILSLTKELEDLRESLNKEIDKAQLDIIIGRFNELRKELSYLEKRAPEILKKGKELFDLKGSLELKLFDFKLHSKKINPIRISGDRLDEQQWIDKERMTNNGKVLFDELCHIFLVQYPQLIANSLLVEQQLTRRSLYFGLEVPVKKLKKSTHDFNLFLADNFKTLGDKPSTRQISDFLALKSTTFTEKVREKKLLETKFSLAQGKSEESTSQLLERVKSLSTFEEASLSATLNGLHTSLSLAVDEISSDKSDFQKTMDELFQDVTKNLSASSTFLDHLEASKKWEENQSYKITWAKYLVELKTWGGPSYQLLNDSTPTYLTTPQGEAIIGLFSFLKPITDKVEENPQIEKKPLKYIGSEQNLEVSIASLHRSVEEALGTRQLFTTMFQQEDILNKETFSRNWKDIPEPVSLDLLIRDFQRVNGLMGGQINLMQMGINLFNLSAILILCLQKSANVSFALGHFNEVFKDRQEFLDRFEKDLSDYKDIELWELGNIEQKLEAFQKIPPFKLELEIEEKLRDAISQATESKKGSDVPFVHFLGKHIPLEPEAEGFVENLDGNQEEWFEIQQRSIQNQELKFLKNFKTQVSPIMVCNLQLIQNGHVYFKTHFYFHTLLETNQLFSLGTSLYEDAKKLKSSSKINSKNLSSLISSFKKCLELSESFHQKRSDGEKELKERFSQLISGTELLQEFALLNEGPLLTSLKQNIQTTQDSLLRITSDRWTTLNTKLASTAKYLDQTSKKYKESKKVDLEASVPLNDLNEEKTMVALFQDFQTKVK